MSDQAESAQKTPRRSRRNQKAPGASSSSQKSSDTQTNNLDSASSSTHPTQVSHPNEKAHKMAQKESLNAELNIPTTPQRPHSADPSSTKKKGGNKSQSVRQKAQPKPTQGGTPSPFVHSATLNPGHVSETPSKAYAGPTFHASPAASSLPMPKFFSKSVPNVDKTTSLKNMLEAENPSEPVSTDEESPSIAHAKLEGDRQVREESPLDIFFKADRQAKTKANTNLNGNVNGVARTKGHLESLRPDASPSRGSLRHHSRHATDSSMGGIFNLEMGSPPPQNPTPFSSKNPQGPYGRSVSASFAEKTDEQKKEEKRQESALALKRMLMVPGTHRSELPNSSLGPDTANLGSPSPKGRESRGSPTRNPPRDSSASPAPPSDSTKMQRQAALRALAEKQIPTSSSYVSQNLRTPAIRKEIVPPSSRENDLDSERTPRPARLGESPPSAHTRSQTKNRQIAVESGKIPIQGLQNLTINSNQQHKVGPSGPSPTTIAIENDLRRILKMDLLGSDGAPGVRS